MSHRHIKTSVLGPERCREMVADFDADAWVYRWVDLDNGWQLSVATLGMPDSGKYSLGGFRIAPAERTDQPGYDNDLEALRLAIGMEEKVSRSRLIGIAGPRTSRVIDDIVGGKCVLMPSPDARVGQPRDFALLDFAAHCLREFESVSGVSVTTGQDLGHGLMSDGKTTSLEYLHRLFPGSILSDTSKPTGEGNYRLLAGVLDALAMKVRGSEIGLIGCGNVGAHVLRRLITADAQVHVIEYSAAKREAIAAEYGIDIKGVGHKNELLGMPIDALVVNANGGTLDPATVTRLCLNSRIKLVCGCENLALPVHDDMYRLRDARIIYAPTEIGGMMGYATAIEEYLSQNKGQGFDMKTMYPVAQGLEEAGRRATRYIIDNDYRPLFDEAINAVYPA